MAEEDKRQNLPLNDAFEEHQDTTSTMPATTTTPPIASTPPTTTTPPTATTTDIQSALQQQLPGFERLHDISLAHLDRMQQIPGMRQNLQGQQQYMQQLLQNPQQIIPMAQQLQLQLGQQQQNPNTPPVLQDIGSMMSELLQSLGPLIEGASNPNQGEPQNEAQQEAEIRAKAAQASETMLRLVPHLLKDVFEVVGSAGQVLKDLGNDDEIADETLSLVEDMQEALEPLLSQATTSTTTTTTTTTTTSAPLTDHGSEAQTPAEEVQEQPVPTEEPSEGQEDPTQDELD